MYKNVLGKKYQVDRLGTIHVQQKQFSVQETQDQKQMTNVQQQACEVKFTICASNDSKITSKSYDFCETGNSENGSYS